MRSILFILLLVNTLFFAHAFVINEVMSNPIGDDSGREWIEIYNNTESDIDVSSLTVVIKSGAPVQTTLVSGGTVLSSHRYAVIGSTQAGVTKFLQDYPLYQGILLKSSISLVNTGVTSIEVRSQGVTMDSIPSYTAAKEGSTYSLINGAFTVGNPTPGEENTIAVSGTQDATTSGQTGSQTTIPQMSSPSADIVLYLPFEKTVVAGAPSSFSTQGMTHNGKAIDSMLYSWSFGDGGQSTGSTTIYRYFYPGKYIAQVEGTNGLVAGVGRMSVRVIAPDIQISTIGIGKYGPYIDITNPNTYDLDVSLWKLSIDGALFSFPKNTILAQGVTRLPGLTMGFASTTVSSSTLIKLLFPNMDEVMRVIQGVLPVGVPSISIQENSTSFKKEIIKTPIVMSSVASSSKKIQKQSTVVKNNSTSTPVRDMLATTKKDVRLATFIRSFFGK